MGEVGVGEQKMVLLEINKTGIVINAVNVVVGKGTTDVEAQMINQIMHQQLTQYYWGLGIVLTTVVIYLIIRRYWRKDLPNVPNQFWVFVVLINIIMYLAYSDTGQIARFFHQAIRLFS